MLPWELAEFFIYFILFQFILFQVMKMFVYSLSWWYTFYTYFMMSSIIGLWLLLFNQNKCKYDIYILNI